MDRKTEDGLSLSLYDYDLPSDRIAQSPVVPRDRSRLMVLHRSSGLIEHRWFSDLPEYLDSSDLLVANNTKVMKARLLGRRLLSRFGDEPREWGGKIEMLLLERREDLEEGEKDRSLVWEGAFHSAAKQVPGVRFAVEKPAGGYLEGELIRGTRDSSVGTVVARFSEDPLLAEAGHLPLPHYIHRSKAPSAARGITDDSSYQTIYAKELGSAAAPTAGLHFTPDVRSGLSAKGAKWEEVTLHVGLGTFRPVKTENIREHSMHEERYHVADGVAQRLTEHRRSGGRVLCVGTTSVRTLESAYDPVAGVFRPGSSATSIFIYPGGRKLRAVDRLLTNFHLPKSTLLMLVSAFAGRDFVLRAYREAVEKGYRFFSYGDAMLIL
jgi:S-adenosylmethionine:tRNA ribosyltransferase-isomerase